MKFEWDSEKNAENIKERGLSFSTATAVFTDSQRLTWQDTRKDYPEERFITIGKIDSRVHVVAFCERHGDTIRIISARKANRREQKRYAES